jgi:hypothetical protein
LYRKQLLLANNCLAVSLFVNSIGLKFLAFSMARFSRSQYCQRLLMSISWNAYTEKSQ